MLKKNSNIFSLMTFNLLGQQWTKKKLYPNVNPTNLYNNNRWLKKKNFLKHHSFIDIMMFQEVELDESKKIENLLSDTHMVSKISYNDPDLWDSWRDNTNDYKPNGTLIAINKKKFPEKYINFDRIMLSNDGNYGTIASFIHNDRNINCMSCHFETINDYIRHNQFDTIQNFISNTKDPVIIGGDFNINPTHRYLNILYDSGLINRTIDISNEFTVYEDRDGGRYDTVDMIMSCDNFESKGSYISKSFGKKINWCNQSLQLFGSDHFPVFTYINLK